MSTPISHTQFGNQSMSHPANTMGNSNISKFGDKGSSTVGSMGNPASMQSANIGGMGYARGVGMRPGGGGIGGGGMLGAYKR